MPSFRNRVALITGAGRGLGRELALALAREGARIAAVDLTPEPLTSLAAAVGSSGISWATADVTARSALHDAVGRLQQDLGPIDLLIANAGIGFETSALAFQAEAVETHVRVNLIGVANSIDAVLPGMLSRRQGQLVAISSLASFRGIPGMAGYSASKAGVNALMDALRVELKPQGIAVTTICPGWIRTALTAQLDFQLPALMEADQAARLIVEAVRRRRAFYAFPFPMTARMRLLRWLPCRASDWLLARALKALGKE